MSLIISIGKLVDELPGQKLMRVVYKGEGYGFQETPHSQALLLRVLEGAMSIEDMHSEKICSENVNAVLSRVTKSKYGIIAHQCSGLFNESIRMLPVYRSRLRRNMACNIDAGARKIIEDVFLSKGYVEGVNALLPLCGFVTMWPKYWGEYGEHFFVVSNNLEQVEASIRDVLCG